ncbi:NAD(P)-binding protein [Spiribacter vilamensis]|uniref:Amine oxidase domain-containing protein n=1 Tax=Spiribacter vilamensis TaxID=531306 RepID=A0A4Q8CZC7_9GAMM|nr:NAD(P)-binding protein [Spiribacter vilamensis]RZU98378.1 hypothetical protein EV698_0624 [Spiribacter vilamensis]TVO60740.1 hypothetical protein FPL09_00805 [Spiribacter vilamensis]
MSDSASNSVPSPHAVSVAIIGNGIAGSSVARSLALTMPDHLSRITLYEIGRGPGGRAATRKTRSIPEFRVNHGAPYADISTDQGRDLLPSLGDAVKPYSGTRCFIDGATGELSPDEKTDDVALITGENGEMANIASSLLLDGDSELLTPITTRYSTMVRGLSHDGGGDGQWTLTDKNGEEVGTADWLIVSGSGVAHPRWSATFGGEPPLVAAATELDDSRLNESLEAIARQTAAPVLTVLFYGTDEVAAQWRRLGFSDALVKDHDVLSKISIQPCDGGGCSVVLHSTIGFARENAGVHGSSSSAARVGDASSDTSREEDLIDEMLLALSTIPGMPAFDKSRYAFGPLLHRWGNAYPEGDPLSQALSVCPDARVAFCGDYVSTSARMGSYESALLSGVNVAEEMHGHIAEGKS